MWSKPCLCIFLKQSLVWCRSFVHLVFWKFWSWQIFFFNSRRWILERKLASSDVPNEERINLIKDLERKETEYMRLKRHKICVNDFELLTIIGRGAFGEVRTDTGMLIFVHERILVGHAMNHYLVLFGNGKSSACLPCKGCFLYYLLLTNSITG